MYIYTTINEGTTVCLLARSQLGGVSVIVSNLVNICNRSPSHFSLSLSLLSYQVLELLVTTYKKLDVPDYISVCQVRQW